MIWTLVILAAGTALATIAMVWVVRGQLLRHNILDTPNARSSHDVPTPRGGGIGVMSVLLPVWIVIAFAVPSEPGITARWVIPLAAIALAAISWIDDLRTLGALPRLGVQVLAAIAGVLMLQGPVFQGLLPFWLDATITVIGWIWFVNLFNFMDGIDGISGVEAIGIGGGVALIGFLAFNSQTACHGTDWSLRPRPQGFWCGTGIRQKYFSATSAASHWDTCSDGCSCHWRHQGICPLRSSCHSIIWWTPRSRSFGACNAGKKSGGPIVSTITKKPFKTAAATHKSAPQWP